ncbi:unnamed protein product [Symbiodinium sp. CCMP2592]|nr:unnamed protein product [Symbiodinium sp. CCMP2592]
MHEAFQVEIRSRGINHKLLLKSEGRNMQHVAGAAFRAILQNIQALELSFATKAVECFRSAGEGQLNYDKTMQALGTLELTDFLGEMREAQGTAAREANTGVLLGSGSEYRRLWTLWSENQSANEQCFLFIAWRAHRFSEPSFVKEIAMPLFQILDHNSDQLITAEELEEAIMSEDPQKQLTEEARADAKKLRSELKELLLYHCDAAAPNGSKGVDFPAFLAFICDAQDKCAMRRYTSKGPVECMARYHKGVVFLRPVNVAECAQPQEQEALGRFLWAWCRDVSTRLAQSQKAPAAPKVTCFLPARLGWWLQDSGSLYSKAPKAQTLSLQA